MAQSLITALSNLRLKADNAAKAAAALQARNEQLSSEVDNLRRLLAERDAKIAAINLDRHFLSISYRLADNPDSLIESRRHIAKLIRNLDTCIALLKE